MHIKWPDDYDLRPYYSKYGQCIKTIHPISKNIVRCTQFDYWVIQSQAIAVITAIALQCSQMFCVTTILLLAQLHGTCTTHLYVKPTVEFYMNLLMKHVDRRNLQVGAASVTRLFSSSWCRPGRGGGIEYFMYPQRNKSQTAVRSGEQSERRELSECYLYNK